jgi:hypothetical protein
MSDATSTAEAIDKRFMGSSCDGNYTLSPTAIA